MEAEIVEALNEINRTISLYGIGFMLHMLMLIIVTLWRKQ